ncbi:MAG: methyltransferase, TIGR04325 family [Lysobacteraceae bacterium]|nr:MAG: methyltransferase, TIGR04325 family [Xanthomonadaceae bacterium]
MVASATRLPRSADLPSQRLRLVRIAREAMELPGLSALARPMYRRYFQRPYKHGNLYYGVFASYREAQDAAEALASDAIPSSYDVEQAPLMYLGQLQQLRACDYPALHWVDHVMRSGGRKVLDLGGHIGVAYYGFKRYLPFPQDLDWCVHDLSHVREAGARLAERRGEARNLRFTGKAEDADGVDLLISTGALQYLPYSLPDLLSMLERRPRHVIFNLTPLHLQLSFFTLQNLGIAICPYRIGSLPRLVGAMADLGYQLRDQWELADRHVHIPFHEECNVQAYQGGYFELAG